MVPETPLRAELTHVSREGSIGQKLPELNVVKIWFGLNHSWNQKNTNFIRKKNLV